MATPAKASLTSNTSMSASVRRPSRANPSRTAAADWDSSDGSGPATEPVEPISAIQSRPRRSASARLMTTTAHAPSEIWLADRRYGAVLGECRAELAELLDGRRRAHPSIGGQLAAWNWSVTSSSKRPFSMASVARA
jgi:hypothetical protein